jgi:hypothetical protein
LLALWMIGSSLVPLPATADEAAPTAALVAEVRRAFTLNGKQIPPEIFRDFGAGEFRNHVGDSVDTDWTRAFAVVNYEQAVEQAVEPFLQTDRLSDTERAMLMGGACAKA